MYATRYCWIIYKTMYNTCHSLIWVADYRNHSFKTNEIYLSRHIFYAYSTLSIYLSSINCNGSFNPSTTRELFITFNFQAEGFLRASRYRQNRKNNNNPQKYLYDLRTNYIHFVLAFIQHGDADIKKQVLSVKGLVSALFTQMYEDAYPLIELILNTTYEHLILDSAIPRSIKAFFFSSYILEKIAKLYTRNEPEPINSEETATPADIVHHFLISTCSVPDVGVCFRDTAWYPAIASTEDDKPSRIHNRVLAKFILTLKPADDLRQQELLLKILNACPELVQEYWKNTSLTFEPRISSKWLGNATVLQKIISLDVPALSYGTTGMYAADPPAVDTILDNILPNAFGRAISSKGLQHASPLVRYTTMVVLAASFQKYNKVKQAFQKVIHDLERLEDGSRSSEAWSKCLQHVHEGLRRRTPEIQTVINLYKQTLSQKNEGMDKAEQESQREFLYETALRVIRYYQEFLPETLMEANIDVSNFIPEDILSVKPGLLMQLLHLFLSMSTFNWTSRSSGSSSTHLTTLLTLYLQTPYQHIRELTGNLIYQTLSESFMFAHDPEEVQLWLNALPQNHSDQVSMSTCQSDVLQYLDNCIHRFSKTQYKYTDQLVSLVDSVHKEQPAYLPSEYKHPFSPLLLTLCENLKFIKTDKTHAVFYLTNLILHLFTKQTVPYYLRRVVLEITLDDSSNHTDPTKIGVWDIHQMMHNLKTCLGIEVAATKQIKSSSSNDSFRSLITEENVQQLSVAKMAFTNALEQLPVCALDSCLEDAARFCYESLNWRQFEPLVDYLCTRHPLAGSFFHYSALHNDQIEDKYAIALLKQIPFTYHLYNTVVLKDYSNGLALNVSEYAIHALKVSQIPNAITFIFLQLLIAVDGKDYDALRYLFNLLQHIIKRTESIEDYHIQTQLQQSIFMHPLLDSLRSELVTTLSSDDTSDLVRLAVAFIDMFAHGNHNAHMILSSLIKVDMKANDDKRELLVALVRYIYTDSYNQDVMSSQALHMIADMWKSEKQVQLTSEMLSLLEAISAKQQDDPALIELLAVFCKPIVQHVLEGKECSIPMAMLQSACVSAALDVSGLIERRLDTLVLTNSVVDLIMIADSSLLEDRRAEFNMQVIEYIIRRLANGMPTWEGGDFFDKLTKFVKASPIEWSHIHLETVRDFILVTLMDNISDACAIRFIDTVVGLVYGDWTKLEPLETYLRRILDHHDYSKLTDPNLACLAARQIPENDEQRRALIQLIHTLNRIQPDILAKNHGLLDTLLTSYGATTSFTDKLLLDILMTCERHSRSSLLTKLTMWGPGTDKIRQAHMQAGTLLRTNAVSSDTLGLIDPTIMKYTFTHFSDATRDDCPPFPVIYDPCFFLPLFANIISSGIADCRKLIDCNGVGLILVGMSSTDDSIRQVCYQMMDQFYILLEHAKFKEQGEVIFVLDLLRHSITDRSQTNVPRVPLCISVCVAHTLSILLHPGHLMFPHISKWILQRPTLDFDVSDMHICDHVC
ncbi:unnamed protein product [Rhizopus microsporus]